MSKKNIQDNRKNNGKKSSLTPHQKKRILALRKQRWSLQSIASEVECTRGQVEWHLRKEGAYTTSRAARSGLKILRDFQKVLEKVNKEDGYTGE